MLKSKVLTVEIGIKIKIKIKIMNIQHKSFQLWVGHYTIVYP